MCSTVVVVFFLASYLFIINGHRMSPERTSFFLLFFFFIKTKLQKGVCGVTFITKVREQHFLSPYFFYLKNAPHVDSIIIIIR